MFFFFCFIWEYFFFFFKQKTAYEMLRSLVGSEMCIRDSVEDAGRVRRGRKRDRVVFVAFAHGDGCLLYTSDAADDLTRVDLGGRRIFQAEDGIRDAQESRGLGDVYKRQRRRCRARSTGSKTRPRSLRRLRAWRRLSLIHICAADDLTRVDLGGRRIIK